MSQIVTKEQAHDIAISYRQIENAVQMKKEILEIISKTQGDPEYPFHDVFGRPAKMELRIPSSSSSYSHVRVEHRMVLPILDVAIAEAKKKLNDLNREIFSQ